MTDVADALALLKRGAHEILLEEEKRSGRHETTHRYSLYEFGLDAGEIQERLQRLTVWRHVDDYTPAEKAAFAWTEALTSLQVDTNYEALRGELRRHFDDAEISAITAAVAMINLWNRVQVSNH